MTQKMGWGRWMSQKIWYTLFVVGVDIRNRESGGGLEMDGSDTHPDNLGETPSPL